MLILKIWIWNTDNLDNVSFCNPSKLTRFYLHNFLQMRRRKVVNYWFYSCLCFNFHCPCLDLNQSKNNNCYSCDQVKIGEDKRESWNAWANTTAAAILKLLTEHKRGIWSTSIDHIECLKSYGPRIYHLVYDIRCSKLDV